MAESVVASHVDTPSARRRLGHYECTHGIQRSEISRLEVPLHISSKTKHVQREIALFGRTHNLVVKFEEGEKALFGMGDYIVVLTADGSKEQVDALEKYIRTLFSTL